MVQESLGLLNEAYSPPKPEMGPQVHTFPLASISTNIGGGLDFIPHLYLFRQTPMTTG